MFSTRPLAAIRRRLPLDRTPALLAAALLLAAQLLLAVMVPTADAAEPLTVHLRSGRVFTALVDARTGDDRLWLRFEGRSAKLLRPIAWERIVAASHQGRDIQGPELFALAQSIKSDAAAPFTSTAPVPGQTRAETARRILLPAQAKAAALHIAATPRNWDADAGDDGLVLTPAATARDGRTLAVGMRLEVTLSANRHDPHHWLGQGDLRVVQRWVVELSADELAGGQGVQLPYNSGRDQWGAVGRLHVRAVVDGHGVLEAEQNVTL